MKINPKMISQISIARLLRALPLLVASVFAQLSAAPYPPDGLEAEWTQPDGTVLQLRVFGDEFYARTATSDGRTVVYVPEERAYFYAEVSADGAELVSNGQIVTAIETAQDALKVQVAPAELSPEARKKIWEENYQALRPDERDSWAATIASAYRREGIPLENPTQDEETLEQGISEPAVTGDYIGLTILIQFPDDPETATIDPTNFPATPEQMEKFCNGINYTEGSRTGSVRDYFLDQSLNKLDYTQVITPIITLPKPRNAYNFSDYPTNKVLSDAGTTGRALLSDAIAILKAQNFDFSRLTVNSRGRVVATNILFAGNHSGVWPKGLWPHRSSVPAIDIGDGHYISPYQITNARYSNVSIGVFCHENGHLLLNYPDLYDYDSDSSGIGRHGLMAGGNNNNGGNTPAPINGYFKFISGWSNMIEISPSTSLTADLRTDDNSAYVIRKPGTSTELFFVENRGTGDPWASYVPDKGILIWHIDDAVRGNNKQEMTPTSHYQVSLEQADGTFDLENHRDSGDSRDLYDNTTQGFTDSTLPNANWWDGSASGIQIEVLSSPGQTMTVKFGSEPIILTPNISANPTSGAAPLAVTFDGRGSTISQGSITSYSWDFRNDGSYDATGPVVNHTYPAGTFTARLRISNGSETAEKTIQISSISQRPYGNGGSPWPVPGLIQAENFDSGGSLAYFDTTADNLGGQYRTSDQVDIAATGDTGGGHNIGFIATGEWLEYTVNVAEAGTYTLDLRVAGLNRTGIINLLSPSNNLAQLTSVAVTPTGAWQSYKTVRSSTFNLAAGEQVLRIYFAQPGMNMNWLRLNKMAPDFANFISKYPSLSGADAQASADPDGDGLPNLLEQWLGLDPTSASSAASSLPRIAGRTNPSLTFSYQNNVSGSALSLLTSDTLNGFWQQVPLIG